MPMGSNVVTIGTFDGVHRGHQDVLAAARRTSERLGAASLAYTFDVPPRTVAEGDAVRLLLPPSTKRRLLARWVDRVIEAPFDEVRDLAPREFVRDILQGTLDAQAVVVGESFRFGAGRSGDVAALGALAAEAGLGLEVVPSFALGGEAVSSTRIRRLLESGNIEQAIALLGRPPLLRGEVVPGDAIGRTLGFPTANLSVDLRVLLPKHGIYLTRAYFRGTRSLALAYVGRRPTLAASPLRCEVHLFDSPERDLSGETLEVHLYRFLRDERRFPSLAALRGQMQLDLEAARRDAHRFPDASDPNPIGG